MILVRVTTAATLLAIDQSVVWHASVSLACVGSKTIFSDRGIFQRSCLAAKGLANFDSFGDLVGCQKSLMDDPDPLEKEMHLFFLGLSQVAFMTVPVSQSIIPTVPHCFLCPSICACSSNIRGEV